MNLLTPCRRLSLPLALAVFAMLVAALVAGPAGAATAPPKAPAPAASAAGVRRIELPGMEGKPFPYTVELPAGWRVHAAEGSAGLWLGPADSKPGTDPRMIYVRISPASLADPEEVAANIRSSDAVHSEWSASRVEVREVGGVRGVLVQMDGGEGAEARSTLALKLPLAKTSVDFLGSAKRTEFATLGPAYEKILLSVRRLPVSTPGEPTVDPTKPAGSTKPAKPVDPTKAANPIKPAKPPGR